MAVSRAAIMQAERCGIWVLARQLACYCRNSCLGVIVPDDDGQRKQASVRPIAVLMTRVAIRNSSKQVVLGDAITVADTAATRRTGLLRRQGLAQGEGLWIVPCEAVHTFRMNFPIDVLFIDRDKRVTKIVANMKRSRMAMSWRARSVIELPAGTAEKTGTEVGDKLEVQKLDG